MELKDYVRILKRRWKLAVLVFAAVLGADYLYLAVVQPVRYAASCELLVKRTEEEFYGPVLRIGEPRYVSLVVPFAQRVRRISTRYFLLPCSVILGGRDPLEALRVEEIADSGAGGVGGTGSTPGEASAERRRSDEPQYPQSLVGEFQRLHDSIPLDERFSIPWYRIRAMLKIKSDNEQQTVTLTAEGEDPVRPRHLVYVVAHVFRLFEDERLMGRFDRERRSLLDRQGELQRELESLTEQMTQLVTDEFWKPPLQLQAEVDLRRSFNEKIRELELALEEIEVQRRMSEELDIPLPRLQEWIGPVLPPWLGRSRAGFGMASSELEQVEIEMRRVQLELAALEVRYFPAHPSVRAGREGLARLQEMYAEMVQAQPGTGMDIYALQRRRIELLIDFYKQRLASTLQRVQELRPRNDEYERIETRLEKSYEAQAELETRLSELKLRRKAESEAAAVFNRAPPAAATELARADFQATLPFAVIIGALLGVASCYLVEYFTNVLRTPMDVKTYLNLPTIATIPMFHKEEKLSLLETAVKSPIAEVYNSVSTFIESVALEQRISSCLITSAKEEEGKSSVSANVAMAMAQGGERVILVDSDLRKPQLHVLFGLDNSRGVSTILAGEPEAEQEQARLQNGGPPELEQYLQSTSLPQLHVLTSGPVPPSPVSLLKSDRMRQLERGLLRLADIVIYDSPPLIGVIDAAILASSLDATILVVEERAVTRREAAVVKHALAQVGANVVGAVINKGTLETEEYYYYYRYRSEHRGF